MEYRITKNAKHDKWRVETREIVGPWHMVLGTDIYTTLTEARRKLAELNDAENEYRWEPV